MPEKGDTLDRDEASTELLMQPGCYFTDRRRLWDFKFNLIIPITQTFDKFACVGAGQRKTA